MPFKTPALLIGVSARIYYPAGPVLDLGGVWTKTLHYLEQSVAQLLVRNGALPVMIPAVDSQSVVQRSDLHHGLANALMIDTVLAWNHEAVPEKFDELAHVARVAGGGFAFIGWLKQLKQRIGIVGGLAGHGVTHEHLPRLVPLAAADFTGRTNPRPATEADYDRLFRQAM